MLTHASIVCAVWHTGVGEFGTKYRFKQELIIEMRNPNVT